MLKVEHGDPGVRLGSPSRPRRWSACRTSTRIARAVRARARASRTGSPCPPRECANRATSTMTSEAVDQPRREQPDRPVAECEHDGERQKHAQGLVEDVGGRVADAQGEEDRQGAGEGTEDDELGRLLDRRALIARLAGAREELSRGTRGSRAPRIPLARSTRRVTSAIPCRRSSPALPGIRSFSI